MEAELADLRRRLERFYNLMETTDMDIDNFKPRIRDHRKRKGRLEATVFSRWPLPPADLAPRQPTHRRCRDRLRGILKPGSL